MFMLGFNIEMKVNHVSIDTPNNEFFKLKVSLALEIA